MANKKILFPLVFVPVLASAQISGLPREALDWGMILGMGGGGYLFHESEPFFEEPLIPGPGEEPLLDERIPDSWMMVANAGFVGAAVLLPNQDGWFNSRTYRHLKGSMQAVTSCLLIKEFAKCLVGRPRPDYYDRIEQGFEIEKARKSWPSGHATHAFNVATYLSLYTWDEWRSNDPWAVAAKSGITALLASGACWVSWTRIRENRHYPGDVVAGSILGAGTALLAYSWQNWWGAPQEQGTSDQSSIIQATPLSIGVRLSF
jgi:membrane-associated phospholipid phosphatase